VVTKLFNIVKPDRAYFGKKDFQQLQVIKRFTEDLNMDVQIIGMPIVREADGLALSSRNVYLKAEERESALSLSKSFSIVREMLDNGERNTAVILKAVTDFINSHPHAETDYVQTVNPLTLEPVTDAGESFQLALAVKVGMARLIDNNHFEV
jgi:pantoate--beta-alanine ligase